MVTDDKTLTGDINNIVDASFKIAEDGIQPGSTAVSAIISEMANAIIGLATGTFTAPQKLAPITSTDLTTCVTDFATMFPGFVEIGHRLSKVRQKKVRDGSHCKLVKDNQFDPIKVANIIKDKIDHELSLALYAVQAKMMIDTVFAVAGNAPASKSCTSDDIKPFLNSISAAIDSLATLINFKNFASGLLGGLHLGQQPATNVHESQNNHHPPAPSHPQQPPHPPAHGSSHP